MNEANRTNVQSRPAGQKHGRRWLAAAAAAGLLTLTPVLAHGGTSGSWGASSGPSGAWGPGGMSGMTGPAGMAGMPGMTGMPGMPGAAGMPGMAGMPGFGMHEGGVGGFGAQAALHGLPLGTVVTVTVFDADPAEGASATAELTATVGETSEVAFASELQDATAEAAYLQISVSERTHRIVLADANGLRGGPRMLAMPLHALELGQAIEIDLYASEADEVPSTTLRFVYGEDSEAAFRDRLSAATEGAAVAEVTLPATERVVDLAATPFGGAAMRGGAMHGGATYGGAMHDGPRPATPPRR